VLGERGRDRGLVGGVEPDRGQPRVAEPVHDCPRAVEVVVGHDELLREVAADGDGRRCPTGSARTHQEDSHYPLRRRDE
jgi:hypothetical protein